MFNIRVYLTTYVNNVDIIIENSCNLFPIMEQITHMCRQQCLRTFMQCRDEGGIRLVVEIKYLLLKRFHI